MTQSRHAKDRAIKTWDQTSNVDAEGDAASMRDRRDGAPNRGRPQRRPDVPGPTVQAGAAGLRGAFGSRESHCGVAGRGGLATRGLGLGFEPGDLVAAAARLLAPLALPRP